MNCDEKKIILAVYDPQTLILHTFAALNMRMCNVGLVEREIGSDSFGDSDCSSMSI